MPPNATLTTYLPADLAKLVDDARIARTFVPKDVVKNALWAAVRGEPEQITQQRLREILQALGLPILATQQQVLDRIEHLKKLFEQKPAVLTADIAAALLAPVPQQETYPEPVVPVRYSLQWAENVTQLQSRLDLVTSPTTVVSIAPDGEGRYLLVLAST